MNDEDRRKIYIYWLVIILCALGLLTMIASCRTIEYVDRPVVHTEIEYRDRVDSVNVHDSIFIKEYQKGDTVKVVEYRERTRFHYIQLIDTVAVRDTVTVVNEKVVEKTVAAMNKVQTFFFWCGITAACLLIIFVVIKIGKFL